MFAILSFHASSPARPFRVTGPDRTRTYSTFAAAAAAARAVFNVPTAERWPTAAELTGPFCGNPLAVRTERTEPAARPDPVPTCVDVPRGVFRCKGTRGMVTVQRDVTARGRDAAKRNFETVTGIAADTVRHLSRRNPDGKAARVRKGTANRSAKIRRQRSATETRLLRNATR